MLSQWPRTKGSTAKRVQLVAGPTAEPISFELQKAAMKVGNLNTSSFAVMHKIAAARGAVEGELHRCLVQQTFDLFVDDESSVGNGARLGLWDGSSAGGDHGLGWPEITLPLPPTQAVLGCYVTDDSDVETKVDPSVYQITRAKEPCRVRLQPTAMWPVHRSFEGLRIRFTAGYTTPFTLSTEGILLLQNHGYRNGDLVRFSSLDGTLPKPLAIQTNYLVTNLSTDGFQVTDLEGTWMDLSADEAQGWVGTGFAGEIPSEIIEAMVLISALNLGGEIRPKASGGGRNNPLALPIDPISLLHKYVWPIL